MVRAASVLVDRLGAAWYVVAFPSGRYHVCREHAAGVEALTLDARSYRRMFGVCEEKPSEQSDNV